MKTSLICFILMFFSQGCFLLLEKEKKEPTDNVLEVRGFQLEKQFAFVFPVDSNDLSREMVGLIINRTITRMGNEFYERFSQRYGSPQNNILISEKPNHLFGSLIEVRVNNTLVARVTLKSRERDIEDISKSAVIVTKKHVSKISTLRKRS